MTIKNIYCKYYKDNISSNKGEEVNGEWIKKQVEQNLSNALLSFNAWKVNVVLQYKFQGG